MENTNTQAIEVATQAATQAQEVQEEVKELSAVQKAHKALVDAVILKLASAMAKLFNTQAEKLMDVALETGKALGYIAGRKGKNGGLFATGSVKTDKGEVKPMGAQYLGDEAKAFLDAIAKAEKEAAEKAAHGPMSLSEQAKALGIEVKGKRVSAEALLAKLTQVMKAQQAQVQAQPVQAPVAPQAVVAIAAKEAPQAQKTSKRK